jgi:hypothetical protein
MRVRFDPLLLTSVWLRERSDRRLPLSGIEYE